MLPAHPAQLHRLASGRKAPIMVFRMVRFARAIRPDNRRDSAGGKLAADMVHGGWRR